MGLVTPSRHVRNPQPIDNGVDVLMSLVALNSCELPLLSLFSSFCRMVRSWRTTIRQATDSTACSFARSPRGRARSSGCTRRIGHLVAGWYASGSRPAGQSVDDRPRLNSDTIKSQQNGRASAGERSGRRRVLGGLSARNRLWGFIDEVRVDGLLAQVRLRVGNQSLTAVIAADAVRALKLLRGEDAIAIVKSTEFARPSKPLKRGSTVQETAAHRPKTR